MKALRILYWISLTISLAHLALSLFGPFGGPFSIYRTIQRGMFQVTSGYNVYDLHFPPYSSHPAVPTLLLLNSTLTFLHFLALFASTILPFLQRMNIRTKYLTGITLCVTAFSIIFVGRRIWRYLVFVYVGI
jgi:hypothetical protein